jgi:hypothetical protein
MCGREVVEVRKGRRWVLGWRGFISGVSGWEWGIPFLKN